MAHAPVKYVEKGLSYVAGGLWHGYALASRLMQKESFTPRWSDKPLQKSWEKTKPRARLPARDRFALPDLRPRGAPGDSRRHARTCRSC